jgi:hypothetical protein
MTEIPAIVQRWAIEAMHRGEERSLLQQVFDAAKVVDFAKARDELLRRRAEVAAERF